MVEWYALSAFTEIGPMSRDALEQLIASGEMEHDTPVRCGDAPWRPAREIPGLCEAKLRQNTSEPVGKPKKSKEPRLRSKITDAIDAAVAAEEEAEERPGMPISATPTELDTRVTSAEVKQEFVDLALELAPSMPLWMMGVGALIALVTLKSASWSVPAFLHYGAIIAALSGMVLFVRKMGRGVPGGKAVTALVFVAALAMFAFWVTVDLQVVKYEAVDGATHRDTIRRWNGHVLSRVRNYRQLKLEYETWGPTDPAGQAHGHWQTHWTEPEANNALDAKGNWFFHGQLVTEAEWREKQKAEGR